MSHGTQCFAQLPPTSLLEQNIDNEITGSSKRFTEIRLGFLLKPRGRCFVFPHIIMYIYDYMFIFILARSKKK